MIFFALQEGFTSCGRGVCAAVLLLPPGISFPDQRRGFPRPPFDLPDRTAKPGLWPFGGLHDAQQTPARPLLKRQPWTTNRVPRNLRSSSPPVPELRPEPPPF